MAQNLERTYNIPLRHEYMKVANYRRTEKASRALREFLVKHMKSEEVKIGKFLNDFIWMHGMKNPPHHVKVNAVKVPEGIVYVELFGKPLKIGKEEKKAVEKKESKTIDAEVVAEKPKEVPKKEKKKE